MVRRLVEDMIRRTPVWPGAFFALALVFAWDTLLSRGRASAAMAMSLVVTFAIGPIAMLARLQTPLIRYLPVSRRDIWRATWLMSTLAPVAAMMVLQLPGTLLTGGWSALTLSATMDLLYAGAGCAVIAAGDTKRGGSSLGLMTPLVILGLGWPIAIPALLPTAWLDVRPVHLALFAAGLALTAWGAFHTPAVTRARAVHPRAMPSTAAVAPARPDRLSGLPRLLAHEFASALGISALTLCLFLGMSFVIDGWVGRPATLHGVVTAQLLFIFDAGTVHTRQAFEPMLPFVWFVFYGAAIETRFPQMLRHLRVLPIGIIRLHALLVAWPALLWSGIWFLLLCVHRLVIGPNLTTAYQLPLLGVCIGLSAVGIAMRLRLRTRWAQAPAAGLLVGLALPGVSQAWLLAIAGLTIALAVALNVSALARSATYKRADLLTVRAQGL